MSKRSLRLAAERRARKLARQSRPAAETPAAPQTETTSPEPQPSVVDQEPQEPAAAPDHPETHRTLPLTDARLEANRRNAQHSSGPTSPLGVAASSQNRTSHGLARHVNGTFRLLPSEDPDAFASFKQSLLNEHQPASETESVLVTEMVEAHWLADRAQHLLDTTCTHPETGDITDRQKFSLLLRYKTTHSRSFHKCSQDLAKLRKEKKNAESGFEAQNVKNQQQQAKKDEQDGDICLGYLITSADCKDITLCK